MGFCVTAGIHDTFLYWLGNNDITLKETDKGDGKSFLTAASYWKYGDYNISRLRRFSNYTAYDVLADDKTSTTLIVDLSPEEMRRLLAYVQENPHLVPAIEPHPPGAPKPGTGEEIGWIRTQPRLFTPPAPATTLVYGQPA